MIGGGCTFLKLAQKVDDIKSTLENDEQRASPLYHLYSQLNPHCRGCTGCLTLHPLPSKNYLSALL